MEALHIAGIWFAEVLQSGPPWLETFWISVTSLADPKSIFTVFFPLAYFLDHKVGLSVLWIGLVSEWLNVVLKWFLFGERPYWWVHESGLASMVTLRQFPVSCETGPGSPSGHCMITAAALWPLVSALSARVAAHSRSPVMKLVPFGAYALLQLTVGLSRIFVLAHFPHQVVAGVLMGAALGQGLQAWTPTAQPPDFFAATALCLLLGSFILHTMVFAIGLDADWSIRLATKWCQDPAWLRLDTQPFASIYRDAGSAVGLGLAALCPLPQGSRLQPQQRLAGAVLAVVATQGLQRLPQPANVLLWYSRQLLIYAIGPCLVSSILPQLLLLTCPQDAPWAE